MAFLGRSQRNLELVFHSQLEAYCNPTTYDIASIYSTTLNYTDTYMSDAHAWPARTHTSGPNTYMNWHKFMHRSSLVIL